MTTNQTLEVGGLARNLSQTRHQHRPKTAVLSILCSGLLAASVFTVSGNAHADIGATHTSIISEFASFNTPAVDPADAFAPGTPTGRVEAITVDGDTVYVGGTFTKIQDPLGGEILDQPYLFAYSKSSGNIIRDFDPVLNNPVYALESTGEGSGVFAGGVFSTLNGEANRRGLVKIDANGDRATGFGARPDALVNVLVRLDDTLYVGGNFNTISGQSVELLAAVDTATGNVLPELNLNFDGTLTNSRNVTRVQGVHDIDVTSDGQLMVVIGNFATIDGISRPRLAVIELENQAKVSTWNTNIFDGDCPANLFVQYIKAIDIAPDDSYFITGSSGFRRIGNPACDTVVRFDFGDLTNTDVKPTWVNYSGGDSVYEVVATDHAIYAGGHFRWMTNETSSNGRNAGPGSQERRGLAALDPVNGLTLIDWRSDRNPRGVGVFTMIAEPEGIYFGDDTNFLNGTEHQKLKFLPVTENTISRPTAPSLPTTIASNDGDALDATSFDGSTLTASTEMFNSGWADARAAVFVGGKLFHADSNSNVWMTQLTDGGAEPRVPVELFGLTNNEWQISQLTGMFFNYEQGRVYYTLQGHSRLYWRAFTPDGPYFGNLEFIAEQQGDIFWSDVTGMDVIDGFLYFTRNDGALYRAEIDGAAPVVGTTVRISGPAIDGRSWDNSFLTFLSEDMQVQGNAPTAQFEFQASGSQTIGRFRTFEFPVAQGEPVVLRLEWLDPNAMLRLFVRDANDALVASDTTAAGSPKFLTVPAGNGGTYTAAVLVAEGSTAYALQVNPAEAAPEPLADFEFSSNGDSINGRFQSFDIDVVAGELVEALVTWDDANADVRVFLRDENRVQVDRNTNGNGSATVSTVATTSGKWSVAVLIRSGAVNYDVLVNTTSDFFVPEPLADFEFSASGTDVAANGRFQSFDIDVVAGEQVEALVTWDDSNADVRVFLRDENKVQVDRNTNGNGTAMISTVAQSSGRWSIAVLIRDAEGTVNYDMLVNTSDVLVNNN